MDAYKKYVKDLSSARYSSEQIQALLIQQGLNQQTIAFLLATIEPPSFTPSKTSPSQAVNEATRSVQSKNLTAAERTYYEAYVLTNLKRGVARAAIDNDLTSRGLDRKTRAALYTTITQKIAREQVRVVNHAQPLHAPLSADEHVVAGSSSQNIVSKTNAHSAGMLHTALDAEPLQNRAAPLPTSKSLLPTPYPIHYTAQQPAEIELIAAAEHLSEVADHLSVVADKLDSVAEEEKYTHRPESRVPPLD